MKQPKVKKKKTLLQWNGKVIVHKNESDPNKKKHEPIYLRVPYFWYVRTKTRVKIMCDENIKSPHPYITPRGTAQWKPNEHQNNQRGIRAK